MDQLKYRLFSLLYKIEFTQFQASNPAMCRTYLPPINPQPLPSLAEMVASWNLTPPDFSQHDLSGYDFSQHDLSDFDFSQHDMSNFDFSQHDMSDFDFSTFNFTPDALSDHPPAPCPSASGATTSDRPPASIDHPPLETPRPSSFSAVKSHSSPDSLESKIESLLTAIDELLAAIKAALRCARAHRISWLKKRLISWSSRTKAIRARVKTIHSSSFDLPSAIQTDVNVREPDRQHALN